MKAKSEKAKSDAPVRQTRSPGQQDGVARAPLFGSMEAHRRAAPLDRSDVLALQARAGNAAVARLIAQRQSGRQPRPTAEGPSPQSLPEASSVKAPAGTLAERRAAQERLQRDSKADASQIRQILTDNTWLGSGNQAEIMAIVRKWATMPAPPGSAMSAMDWLIAGLHLNTYQVGLVVKQYTSAFDEMHRRMSSGNVAEFQRLITTTGRQFRNERPNELVKFEVTQEDIIRGLKAGGELAAAVATGGGSILLQVGYWLASTLPDLWQKAKAIFGLIDSIRSFQAAGLVGKFSPAALGGLLVRGLFGEATRLPVTAGEEPPKPDEGGESSGLVKVLHAIVRVITVVKSAYNKIAHTVNAVLGSIDISGQAWLRPVAMAYAGIVTAIKTVSHPGEALRELADKIGQTTRSFFDTVKGRFADATAEIKGKLKLVVEPVRLLQAVADKAVVTALNFIVTHPPSELVRTVFTVIQTAAGKELIEVVRDQLKPIGDQLIQKIAQSGVVQGAIKPLSGPVHMIADGIDRVTEKGIHFVSDTQSRMAQFLSADKLRELTYLGPSAPAAPVAATEESADFLTVVKHGLHSRLLAIGTAGLADMGKSLAGKGWKTIKSAAVVSGKAAKAWAKEKAARVTSFFAVRKSFTVDGESHSLYSQGEAGELMVASGAPTKLSSHRDPAVKKAYAEYRRAVDASKTREAKERAAQAPLREIVAELVKSFKAAPQPRVTKFRLGRVGYGEGALSRLAQQMRLKLGLRRGGNVAVFEFEHIPEGFQRMLRRLGGNNVLIEGNRVAFQNVSGAAHSEETAHQLIMAGRRSGFLLNVSRIYTEYNPCTYRCLPLIRTNYPSAEVEYSFLWERWGRETPGRNAAVDALFGPP